MRVFVWLFPAQNYIHYLQYLMANSYDTLLATPSYHKSFIIALKLAIGFYRTVGYFTQYPSYILVPLCGATVGGAPKAPNLAAVAPSKMGFGRTTPLTTLLKKDETRLIAEKTGFSAVELFSYGLLFLTPVRPPLKCNKSAAHAQSV